MDDKDNKKEIEDIKEFIKQLPTEQKDYIYLQYLKNKVVLV